MDKYNKTAPSEQSAAASMPIHDKSVSHFNWFARFETQQIPYPETLKSLGSEFCLPLPWTKIA